ncbi:MAG: PC4/YdbC family ssDNA-binding protein [Actinomycetota bacterium]
MEFGELVGSFQKNTNATIRVHKLNFQGEEYIDIREFVATEEYDGLTRKGIRMREALIPKLVELLQKF